MGGEIGSNSAPQPNLEILPKPAGVTSTTSLLVVHILLRIFICGGSTNSAGDAIDNCVTIAPEAANPTWTLERMIFICGGSTNGAGDAIDNCVTIAPEAANPTWTLERMPSKCVMPNLVSLPDGTVFIVNGATQGYAGFGLANNPNLNAVLYDPTWPLGSRFSILNNTIVAHMYHSEVILLPDGRILISGSDP
ncbi:hypothetical protein CVT25_001166 [Psilocybe cyanescens]|uniref:Glyoxal oxidase N-terminal domain-containing protein n=1 Tax=Psilocybe cyanescens TaxID=93625 RepID=A0A409X8K9_PSICY|nr:hypothetical protein CVT25_001166 [Psilocybe cyanescens]